MMKTDKPIAESMAALKDAFLAQRAGRYFVVRGAVNWANWDFVAHPWAVSINIDVCGFVNQSMMTEITLGIEVVARMTEATTEQGIDDWTLDEIRTDIARALDGWKVSRNSDGSMNVFRIAKESAVLKEFHDANKGVQGIVATVDCTV